MKEIETIIRERRTAKNSLDKDVSKELLLGLLETASYAPFHKHEPWQAKLVTTTEEKNFLYEKIMNHYHQDQTLQQMLDETSYTKKMTRLIKEAPATVLFARELIPEKPRLDSDSIQGTAALIQNFSLLLWEAGLVGFWATSPFVLDHQLSVDLGFPDNYQLLANYRVGYRDVTLPLTPAQRKNVTTWVSSLL